MFSRIIERLRTRWVGGAGQRIPTAPVRAGQGMVSDADAARAGGDLAAELDALLLEANALGSALIAGAHGRRRAGQGDLYWQHREMRNGESLRRVDWRRSARDDRLYVREREQEAPTRLMLWVDCGPGMVWRGADNWPTKAAAGLALALGLGQAVRAAGEQVSVLGAGRSDTSLPAMAAQLIAQGTSPPGAAVPGRVLLVTDGLTVARRDAEPETDAPQAALADDMTLAGRADALRRAGADVVVVLVADPAERSFPYAGRLQVSAPGARPSRGGPSVLIGKAEDAVDGYRRAYRLHMERLEAGLRAAGVAVFVHVTSDPLLPVARAVAARIGPQAGSRSGQRASADMTGTR